VRQPMQQGQPMQVQPMQQPQPQAIILK
jgi:hypothetical protein